MAGGGVGEAALLGAVIGGGSSALQGKDPLEGALLGGLTGGAGAGISNAFLGGAGAAMTPATEAALGSAMTGADAAIASEAAGLGAMQPTTFANMPTTGGLFDAFKSFGTSIGDGQSGTTMNALKQIGSSAVDQVANAKTPEKVGYGLAAGLPLLLGNKQYDTENPDKYEGPLSKFKYDPSRFTPYEAQRPNPYYRAQYNSYGLPGYANGGTVEQMSNAASIGANTGYPQSGIQQGVYATPWQSPYGQDVVASAADTGVNPMTGEMRMAAGGPTTGYKRLELEPLGESGTTPAFNTTFATPAQNQALNDFLTGLSNMGIMGIVSNAFGSSAPAAGPAETSGAASEASHTADGNNPGDTGGGEDAGIGSGADIGDGGELAHGGAIRGGIASLGGYSDGGRMLKGPGDGMSDSIPASIDNKRPARLATDEFVIPADVVSHLGNGSSDAGAKQLYAMMDRVRKARTGNKKQGKQINPQRFMPA